MPADAMVSTDIGNICSVSNSYLRFDRPRSMFAAMSFGNCGYAFPTIVGAKVAAPDRPAIAYVGDGAWGMSFGELQTCVRENIPVTAVVFNNGQWGAEKKNHVDFYSRRFQAVDLESPNWAGVAKAFGCDGVTVDRLSDVGPALQAAVRAQAAGRTTVLEMLRSGAVGYLVKGSSADEILDAVRRSVRGESSLSPQITGEVIDELVAQLELRDHEGQMRRRRVDLDVLVDVQMLHVWVPAIRTQATLLLPERRSQILVPPLRTLSPVGFARLGHVSLLNDFFLQLSMRRIRHKS